MKFTDLEKQVIDVLKQPNGNGEVITDYFEDYISLFAFGMDNKTLRGVLASLIKKNIIHVGYDEIDSFVRFTTIGYNMIKNNEI